MLCAPETRSLPGEPSSDVWRSCAGDQGGMLSCCLTSSTGEADACQMIRHLTARRSVELKERDTARLIELCVGHAGLLKASLGLLWDEQQARGLEEIGQALGDEPAVQAECKKMWEGISESEQAALCTLVGGAPADPEALRRLKRKGLVCQGRSESFVLFSPLFADYIRGQVSRPTEGGGTSRFPHRVPIDGDA